MSGSTALFCMSKIETINPATGKILATYENVNADFLSVYIFIGRKYLSGGRIDSFNLRHAKQSCTSGHKKLCVYPAGRICPKWFLTSCLSLRLFGHCLIVCPIGCFTWSATEKPTSTAESSTRLSYRGTFPFSAGMLYNCGVRDI